MILEALLYGAAVVFYFMGMAFRGEGKRGSPTSGVEDTYVLISLALMALPLLTFVWSLYKINNTSQKGVSVAIPTLLTLLIGVPVAFYLLEFSSKAGAAHDRKLKTDNVERLRRETAEGKASYCELVSEDDASTTEAMAKCKDAIERAGGNEAQWRELRYFLDVEGKWKTVWHPGSDSSNGKFTMSVKPQEYETWFIKKFFDVWLARPESLKGPQSFHELARIVGDMGDWGSEAKAVFAKQIIPEIRSRLAKEPAWAAFQDYDKGFIENRLEIWEGK